ncbi:MAG: DUF1501 domain-containing protein [Marinibacterium sp.]
MATPLTRRALLGRAAILGCSAAASPLLTQVSFAAAPWETRLVVIILRGGMDGLDAIRPVGAPEFAALRGDMAGPNPGAQDLDGFFALHPALAPLMPLWADGDLGAVHAVSTPYRDKRSHFDGQDILEAGTVGLDGRRDGWLNRLLQQIPGVTATTAYAIGRGDVKVLLGDAPVADWTPEASVRMSPQAVRLAELIMQDDPMFHAALSEALSLSDDAEPAMGKPHALRAASHTEIAEFAGEKLKGDTRVVAFSMNGWDTHNRQNKTLSKSLGRLAETIVTLKAATGDNVWSRTTVLAMTEFGRTVRLNGTGGTDHGTGGAMLLAGGSIRGGRIFGDWPGLDEADLYKRRDLMPTRDVRAPVAWILRAATGLDRSILETTVFPGLDMGPDDRLML